MPRDRLGMYSERRYPPPIVPRPQVREIPERVDQSGTVILPMDEAAARRAVRDAVDAGAEAIAICLLWSFRNPAHEKRLEQIVREIAGEHLAISLSSDISPIIGEYERTASTVLNAYLGPLARRHFESVEGNLRSHGFRGSFNVLNSIGGVIPAADAANRPVLTLLSGPTGGVTGSRYLANMLGHANVITSDMGGTSFDVSLIVDGNPLIALGRETCGYHLSVPMIDIATIGAGGGSIVSVSDGLIRVGPESAGASPGPVCYGRGGTRATVTDADVVLGIINPERFLGGRMKLDRAASEEAIREQVAKPLGMSVDAAAAGIRRIVDSQMADLVRQVTIGRGHDPRNFVLYAYGGAGPTHCAGYGKELGIQRIVVPTTSMVHSAYGGLASDTLYCAERSRVLQGDASGGGLSEPIIAEEFRTLEAQCASALATGGFGAEDRGSARFLEMRYRMQTHEILVRAPDGPVDRAWVADLAGRFERAYERTYGQGSGLREAGIEIVTFRVEGTGRSRKPGFRTLVAGPTPPEQRRLVYLAEAGRRVAIPVHDWLHLPPQQRIAGPAIIEHPSTTVFVATDQSIELDQYGNLHILDGSTSP